MSISTSPHDVPAREHGAGPELQFHAHIDLRGSSARRDGTGKCHRLSEQHLQQLLLGSQCRAHARNQLICKPGDALTALYVIGRGSARVYRLSPKGQEITIDILVAGSVFGMRLANLEVRSNNFVESTSDETVVHRIPFDRVVEIMHADPSVAVSVLRLAYDCLDEAQDRLADLALYDVKTRLAHTLARLATRGSCETVHATHRELAWIVGTRPEEVTKALRHLRDAGLVEYQPRQSGITVPNAPLLAAYGDESG
jgi:CRP/FNR family cyclic AMP-dependent transcriptional regulator